MPITVQARTSIMAPNLLPRVIITSATIKSEHVTIRQFFKTKRRLSSAPNNPRAMAEDLVRFSPPVRNLKSRGGAADAPTVKATGCGFSW